MPSNVQFKLNLKSWKDQTKENLEALSRQSIQELAYRVVDDTPVDTGFLRGSWQPSIGAPASGPLGKSGKVVKAKKNKSGSDAKTKIAATVLEMKLGDVFYMSNNAAYALRMEYGFFGEDSLGRTYHQAGRYYVTARLGEWEHIVADTAKSLGLSK